MLDALSAATTALLYAGILSAAGAVFAEASLARSRRSRRFLAQLMRRAAMLVVVASLVHALLLIFRLSGRFDEPTLSAVFFSGPGAATALQLAGAFLLLVSTDDDPSARATRLGEAAVVIASLAISGHAASRGFLAGALVFIHVAAAAWWLGSLYLLREACAHARPSAVAQLVRRFGVLAIRIVLGLVAAGVLLVIVLVDFAATPLLTPYLQILALKVCIAAATLSLAAWNRFRLAPRIEGREAAATPALNRMIYTELLFLAALLVVTAILTTYTAPDQADA